MRNDPTRPWPVRLILLYFGLNSLSVGYVCIRGISGNFSVPGPAGEFGRELGVLDYLLALAAAIFMLYAATSLYRLSRAAWPLFIAIFLLGPLIELYHWLTKPAYPAYFAQIGYLALATGIIINVAILVYVRKLRRDGVLRF